MSPKETQIITTLEKSIREYAIKRERALRKRDYDKVRLLDCLEQDACIILNKLKLLN
ncbi:hypothetical protein NK213_19075 [Sebaldella sp. S0638]|nr:hypothetical protein [Sebaldella sp. S0638]